MSKTVIAVTVAVAAATVARCGPTRAVRVASAYTSHVVCSETFVSGLDPDRVYRETVESSSGFGLIDWALHYQVDAQRRAVATTVADGFKTRAVYRDGVGCRVVYGNGPEPAPLPPDVAAWAPSGPPLLPAIAGAAAGPPANPALAAALDHAFAETKDGRRRTKAIVVVQDGHIVAERYAPEIGVDTPLLGNSLTKSMTATLIGILVREGKLKVADPAPVASWRAPGDPRRDITLDNLLRQTSGLDIDETGSGFDPVSRMLMLEPDMAAYAEQAPGVAAPGTRWRYTSGNYIILSRIIRDAVGGDAASVLRFARRELFDPLGMRSVTLEFDAAGTPAGSTFMYASARDWAKLGLLYLDEGVVGGRRILPEGWVAYATARTPGSYYGYAAGWWRGLARTPEVEGARGSGLPPDGFFANGRLGQFVFVVPSKRLVLVRMGVTQAPELGDDGSMAPLIAEVIDALRAKGSQPPHAVDKSGQSP